MQFSIVLCVFCLLVVTKSDSSFPDYYENFGDIQKISASTPVRSQRRQETQPSTNVNRYETPSMSLLAQLTNPIVMQPAKRSHTRVHGAASIERRRSGPIHLPPVQGHPKLNEQVPESYQTSDPLRDVHGIRKNKPKYMSEPGYQPQYEKRRNKQRFSKPIAYKNKPSFATNYQNEKKPKHKIYKPRPSYVKPPRHNAVNSIEVTKTVPIKLRPYPSRSSVKAESTEVHKTENKDGSKIFHVVPKVAKRQTHHGGYLDHKGLQFVAEAAQIENGAGDGRISFQIHGEKGPHSYRFGFDTGKGYNRQFRYEERDNHGHVKGRYGYYDKHGKLRVVNYSAHPKYGFSADVPKYH